jgi:hypothetical protein
MWVNMISWQNFMYASIHVFLLMTMVDKAPQKEMVANFPLWNLAHAVKSPLTHTSWWTNFAMGYRGVWVNKYSFPALWQFWWTQFLMGYKGLWVNKSWFHSC